MHIERIVRRVKLPAAENVEAVLNDTALVLVARRRRGSADLKRPPGARANVEGVDVVEVVPAGRAPEQDDGVRPVQGHGVAVHRRRHAPLLPQLCPAPLLGAVAPEVILGRAPPLGAGASVDVVEPVLVACVQGARRMRRPTFRRGRTSPRWQGLPLVGSQVEAVQVRHAAALIVATEKVAVISNALYGVAAARLRQLLACTTQALPSVRRIIPLHQHGRAPLVLSEPLSVVHAACFGLGVRLS
mmetsp:Transcript_8604/g.32360  ORF Transcript_8604/g.32360 Transcript_8604/m.32360 type:complete len:244 (+) Transcript_8604:971-1702(+)